MMTDRAVAGTTDEQDIPQVILVRNWFQELTERVPAP